jgi:glycosyltransferase involved in cell wall biosynthesis
VIPDLPLVSIITPSFNQARFLEQTIQSVLSQTYAKIEYAVVDGKSTDGSLEIIRKYAKKLTWFVSEKDRGQADAINKGFKKANGELIAWLNSDDLYLPGAVEAAVKVFTKHPNAAIVHADVLAGDAEGRILNKITYKNWGLLDLMRFKIIGQPAVFMRKSMLDKAGYLDLNYHLLLDHQLWLRLGQKGEIVYVHEPWAMARFHENAKNTAQAAQFGDEAKRIVEWMPSQPALREEYRKNENAIKSGAFRISARYYLDADLPRKAFSEYWKSLSLHPGTALQEWHRIFYSLLATLGLSKLKRIYLDIKTRRYQRKANT